MSAPYQGIAMANSEHFKAACNTMVASRWQIWLARILGRKVVGVDIWAGERSEVTMYEWRGKFYLTNVKRSAATYSGD